MIETYFNVTILSFLQGIAEFLPISSSGHLVLAQHLLKCNSPGIKLDLALHVGTLLSIFIFYRSTIARIIMKFEWLYVLKIIVSAIPAILFYFCCSSYLGNAFENTRIVGSFLIVTGFILFSTRFLPTPEKGKEVSFLKSFFMGLGQAFALFPGVSRSGMTLVCARVGKVDAEKSAEFSFLMSAPLILGGMVLEILRAFSSSAEVQAHAQACAQSDISWGAICYGAILSGIIGYFALALLIKTLKSKYFWLFGIYCWCVGLFTLILI